jgi:hypothetical protein
LNGENLFEEITGVLSPIPFCSMFRMNRYSFERRCEYIIVKIGGNVFKLQEWLVLVEGQQSTRRTNCATGGTISGDTKLQLCYASWLEQVFWIYSSFLSLHGCDQLPLLAACGDLMRVEYVETVNKVLLVS